MQVQIHRNAKAELSDRISKCEANMKIVYKKGILTVANYYQNPRGLEMKTHTFFTDACESSYGITIIENWLDGSVTDTELET